MPVFVALPPPELTETGKDERTKGRQDEGKKTQK